MSATATTGPWRDLRKRLTTAALLLPAAIACIWLGAHWFNALLALCVAGLAWEWVRMCGGSTRAMPGMLVPLGVLGGGALAVLGMPLLGLLALQGPQPWAESQNIRVSIVTRPAGGELPGRVLIRATFQRVVYDSAQRIILRQQLNDDELYTAFFARLAQGVFLEARSL